MTRTAYTIYRKKYAHCSFALSHRYDECWLVENNVAHAQIASQVLILQKYTSIENHCCYPYFATCSTACSILHYIMAGRAFVVAKEVIYHGNGSILTL